MNNSPFLIEKNKSRLLKSYLQELVVLTNPEKIFLLKASYDYQLTEDIFERSPLSESSGKYSLFILYDPVQSRHSEKAWFRNFGQLQENKYHQLEFMDVHEFNEKIKTGDNRLTFVLLNGMLWFDKGEIPLADPKLPAGSA